MNLSSELIEHLVLMLLKAKEAKSIKEHDMLGRYINLDGLLSLNLFLKQSLKEDSLPSTISKEVDDICKKLSCADPQTKKLLGKRVLEATIDNINHISYKMCKNQKLLNDKQQAFVPLGKKHKSTNLDNGTKEEIAKGVKEANIDSYQDDIETLKKQNLVLPFTKKSLKHSICDLRDAINELAKQKGALTQNDILRIFGCELSPDGDNELSDDLKFGYGNLNDPTFGGQVKLYKADKYEDKGIVLSDIEAKDLAIDDTSDASNMTFNEAINFFQKLFSNRAKSFISQLDSTAKNESKADMLTLKSAFENYVSNTSISNNWSDSTFGLVRHVGRLMSMNFGDELDIKKIKRDDLLNFRNVLLQLPTKLSQNSLYKDKSIDEIIALAKDRPKISKSTIKKYIVRVSEFFKYCYDSDYIDKNPAIDLQIIINQDDVTNKNPYEDSDVNALLDIVSKIRSNGDTKSQRISKDELFFVTHIAAYSGMRLNEIIQLNTDDIVEKYNIVCFSLNTKIDIKTGKSKTLKTRNSARIVPIHSKLSSIGLFEFIEGKKKLARKCGKAVRLFSCDNKDFSEYFRKKINTKVIKDDDKTRTFHSFRHTFINKLIQSGQRVEHIAALVGHEQQYKITMNTYGEPVTPKILKDLVEEVNFYQGGEG
ncbi:site-specific recombinase, phage integrase family [Campylobacter concisus 13826]|uniref:Site-specific recombinase, phage integrase family n=2 Tax=Campylobacter concisus TaxID=199 RepID=A7ZBT8_CAMC1|nr:tyrosine-type recombinase/integrase [Campylobacter concisus]EAT98834.3 site-specific recombinase, phage integrase family [Campylobacter concisus 13826]